MSNYWDSETLKVEIPKASSEYQKHKHSQSACARADV